MEDNFVHIEREPVTQESFDKLYRKSEGKLHLNDKLKDKFNCSTDKLWRRITSVFPIVAVLRYYNFREKFVNDILAGITVGLFQIPHALAFALLASMKVENGLYTSIWPVMLYAIFGTSIHVSIGTSAVVCMFTRGIVDREVAKYEGTVPFNSSLSSGLLNNSEFMNYKENVALNIGFLCGISLLIFGILKITFIAHLLSEPFLKAFTSAAAVHIIISQLPLVLGINIQTHGGVFKIVNICKDIINNLTYIKGLTLLTAVVTIIVLLFFKEFVNEKFKSRFRIPIPAELMVVILAVTISATTVLHRKVTIIGHISGMIPQPAIPNLTGCQTYLLDSFVLAIFMYANNATLSRIFAKKHNYVVNYNQESFAHGICNFVGSFFHCIPVSASPRRSMVLSLMNTNTTLAGIYIGLFMLIITIISRFVFQYLPIVTLSAIMMVAMKGLLLQIFDVRKYFRIDKFELFIWLCTFSATLLLDFTFGMLIGIGASLIAVVVQTQVANGFKLDRTIESKIMVEHKKYQGTAGTKGIKIFRFQSNLYYANAEIFRNKLYHQTVNPRKLLKYIKKQVKKMQKQLKEAGGLQKNTAETIRNGISGDDNINKTSLPKKEVSDQNSITVTSDIPSISVAYGNVKNRSISTVSRNMYGQDGISRQESVAVSLSSNISNLTLEPEITDPDDGQEYITERKYESMRKVHHIIVDFSTVNYIDLTSAKMLGQISSEYGNVNIKLFLASCSPDIQKTMRHAGVLDTIPADCMFIDLYDAIAIAKQAGFPNIREQNANVVVSVDEKF